LYFIVKMLEYTVSRWMVYNIQVGDIVVDYNDDGIAMVIAYDDGKQWVIKTDRIVKCPSCLQVIDFIADYFKNQKMEGKCTRLLKFLGDIKLSELPLEEYNHVSDQITRLYK
jgi:hypothetical protein